MNVCLPYSKSLRYLTGIDWMIATLDHMTRRHASVGNASQIVLELSGPLSAERLREALTEFGRLFPVLNGRIRRDWNIAPYWQFRRRAAGLPLRLSTRLAADNAQAVAALEEAVNAPMSGPREHVAFHLISTGPERHFVAMTFDHQIFDAYGAEAFLDLFQCWYTGGPYRARLDGLALTEEAHLSDWMRKFDSGKHLNRAVLEMAGLQSRVLTRPSRPRGSRLRLIAFDEEQSARIENAAYRKAGYLMLLPYVLGITAQVLHRAFQRRGAQGADYIVSTSVDLRTPETAQRDLFFNHLSFLFFHFPAMLVNDPDALLGRLKGQMYEQVKADFPSHLAECSHLMRIVPRALLGHLIRMPLGGEFASYGFSQIGKAVFTFPRLMEARVDNLFHMPLVPVPPGLGFVVNRFGKRFNAVVSHVTGLLDDDEAMRIERDARELFGA